MPLRLCLAALALALGPLPAAAQAVSVSECDWRARADALVEPWQAHSRTFSEGRVRLAMLDTIEPAQGWAHLLVLSPPYDELGGRQCRVIGGFAGLDWESLTASYDPARGLLFALEVAVADPGGTPRARVLHVTLNQASGAITLDLR
jgi:hypothetical protein